MGDQVISANFGVRGAYVLFFRNQNSDAFFGHHPVINTKDETSICLEVHFVTNITKGRRALMMMAFSHTERRTGVIRVSVCYDLLLLPAYLVKCILRFSGFVSPFWD